MRTLGIVPARAGSKRIPGKNMRLLAGRPLVEWVLDAAAGATTLDRIVVSSDDDRVLSAAAARDPAWPLRRPEELAGDLSPAVAYVRHALLALEAAGEAPFEVVVILQPTSPLTQPQDIDDTVRLLRSSGADTAVSVVRVPHDVHPLKFKRMEGDRLLPYVEEERGRMHAHDLPVLYVRNCAVYATRRYVIEAGAIIGEDARGHVMPRERSVDINDDVDFQFAEFLLARTARRQDR